MKNFSVLILSLFSACLSFSQNKNLDYKRALKIYNLSTYQKALTSSMDSVSSGNSNNYNMQILQPTIAYSWKAKNQNFHEVELTSFVIKKNEDENIKTINSGATIFSSSVSLRYEYIFNFLKTSDCKFLPSLGLAFNPYYSRTKIRPKTTQTFPTSVANMGLKYSLIPRITWYFSSKCFFDLNIPIDIFEIKNQLREIRDPSIPLRMQRTATPDFKILPHQFSLRLGIGIKI